MASVTKKVDGKTMADEQQAEEPDRGRQPSRPQPPAGRERDGGGGGGRGGFFSIYKKGHGYWTRMGTAAGAALLGLLCAHFLYQNVPVWLGGLVEDVGTRRNAAIGVAAGFLAAYALFCWWVMNKPTNADFLIATDGEMKRVNWTSRKQLFGSTRVVILFMFLIAAFLFAFDLIFGYFFYFINVLQTKPF